MFKNKLKMDFSVVVSRIHPFLASRLADRLISPFRPYDAKISESRCFQALIFPLRFPLAAGKSLKMIILIHTVPPHPPVNLLAHLLLIFVLVLLKAKCCS